MPEEGEKGTVLEKPWQPVRWGKDNLPGFGYVLVPMKPHKKEVWAFSLTLPPNVDPKDFRVTYVESGYGPHQRHTDRFVVGCKVSGQEMQRVIVIPLASGDRRIDKNSFSVHAPSEVQKFWSGSRESNSDC